MTGTGLLAVAVGAVLGAWLRWWLGLALNAVHPSLPLGTVAANLAGGYLIGIAVEWLGLRADLPPEVRLLAVTGFLGALTTFSTFSAEAVGLLSRGQVGWAVLHSAVHLAGSLFCTFLGIQTVRALAH
ncbi:MAG: fluoride efflux transporter CrcB [Burkholderiales bacterium]